MMNVNPPTHPIPPNPLQGGETFRRQSDDMLLSMLQGRIDAIDRDLREMSVTLRGWNGDIGLVGRVAQIEIRLDQIYNLVSDMHNARKSTPRDDHLTSGKLAVGFVKDWLAPIITGAAVAVIALLIK